MVHVIPGQTQASSVYACSQLRLNVSTLNISLPFKNLEASGKTQSFLHISSYRHYSYLKQPLTL